MRKYLFFLLPTVAVGGEKPRASLSPSPPLLSPPLPIATQVAKKPPPLCPPPSSKKSTTEYFFDSPFRRTFVGRTTLASASCVYVAIRRSRRLFSSSGFAQQKSSRGTPHPRPTMALKHNFFSTLTLTDWVRKCCCLSWA